MRSGLWDPERRVERSVFPPFSQVLRGPLPRRRPSRRRTCSAPDWRRSSDPFRRWPALRVPPWRSTSRWRSTPPRRTSWPTGGPRRSAGRSRQQDEAFIRRMVDDGRGRRRTRRRRHRGALVWKVGAAITSPDPDRPRVLFQAVPEPKTVKNRLHLDVRVGAERREAEVARLVALGATELWRGVAGPVRVGDARRPGGQRVLRHLSRTAAGSAGPQVPALQVPRELAVRDGPLGHDPDAIPAAVCGRYRGSARPRPAGTRPARWPGPRGREARPVVRVRPMSWEPPSPGGARHGHPVGTMVPPYRQNRTLSVTN